MIEVNFLDIRTLSFLTLFFSFIYGVGLIIYSINNLRFAGIKTVALAFISLSLGTLLFSLRQYLSDYFTIIIANILIFLHLIFIYQGLIKFCQLNVGKEKYISLLLIAIMLISFHYYVYIVPQVNMRIVIFSFCLSVQSFLCTKALQSNTNSVYKTQTNTMSYLFLFIGFFHLYRMIFMIGKPSIDDFMLAGFIHSLALITFQMTVLFVSFMLIWMSNSILEEELKAQARIDPLTGLNNRRTLEEFASSEIARTIRNNHNLSMIMCDIDHFKEFNDLHGHQTGDDVLVNVASILVSNIRQNDVVCRYGGEEFLILLPETNIEQATILAEKMRLMVCQDKSVFSNNKSLYITLSFGVAAYNQSISDWHIIAKSADDALYQAKNTGRNKVIAAQPINVYP